MCMCMSGVSEILLESLLITLYTIQAQLEMAEIAIYTCLHQPKLIKIPKISLILIVQLYSFRPLLPYCVRGAPLIFSKYVEKERLIDTSFFLLTLYDKSGFSYIVSNNVRFCFILFYFDI